MHANLLSIVVACATVMLNTCSLAWSVYRPGFESGSVRQVRSSEFRRICYRINILGTGEPTVTKQYKFGTGVSWEGNRRSGVALAMRHRHHGLSTYGLNGQRQGDEHPRL